MAKKAWLIDVLEQSNPVTLHETKTINVLPLLQDLDAVEFFSGVGSVVAGFSCLV